MKENKRLLSIMLVFMLMFSLGSAAYAELSDTQYEQFDSVFSIGDSNAMGYGLPGYKGNPLSVHDENFSHALDYSNNELYLHGTPGSFPELTAKALGVPSEKHNTMTYPALRAKDAYFLLGGEVDHEGDRYFYDRQSTFNIALSDSHGGSDFIEQISAKDGDRKLVILFVGEADFFFEAKYYANSVSEIFDCYTSFLEYTPKLIKRIQELNPDARIALLGAFNPVKDLRIKGDYVLPAYDLLSLISEQMNLHYKLWAKQYGCIYVDISNVETGSYEYSLDDSKLDEYDPELVYHATPEGYEYIARQILHELRVERSDESCSLRVDLGSAESVSSVTLNKEILTNYSFDPETHVLLIPDCRAHCGNLKVIELGSDGCISIVNYTVAQGPDGYTAQRSYSVKDLGYTVKQIINNLTIQLRELFSSSISLLMFN